MMKIDDYGIFRRSEGAAIFLSQGRCGVWHSPNEEWQSFHHLGLRFGPVSYATGSPECLKNGEISWRLAQQETIELRMAIEGGGR